MKSLELNGFAIVRLLLFSARMFCHVLGRSGFSRHS